MYSCKGLPVNFVCVWHSAVHKVLYIHLLYVAWADQRHCQCCIRHTEQILNGTVLYDGRQGEGGRTFAFPSLASSPAREATRRATRRFASCFNPSASAKIGRTLAQFLNGTVLYDGRQGEGGRTFAFSRFGELTSA